MYFYINERKRVTGKAGVKVQVMQAESHLTTGQDAGISGILIALNGGTRFLHHTYCNNDI